MRGARTAAFLLTVLQMYRSPSSGPGDAAKNGVPFGERSGLQPRAGPCRLCRELAGYLSDGFAPLTDGDRADLLRPWRRPRRRSRGAQLRSPGRPGGRDYARNLVEEAADAIEFAGWRLEEAGLQLVGGPVTEAAWTAGAEHAKAGRLPAVTDGEGDLAWDGEAARELAALFPFRHRRALAARSLTGRPSPTVRPTPMPPGKTALSPWRAGTWPGSRSPQRSDGREPSPAKPGSAAILASGSATARNRPCPGEPSRARSSMWSAPGKSWRTPRTLIHPRQPAVAGDVLLVQSDNSAWLFSRGEARPPTQAALPAQYCSREEAGLRMAEKITSPEGTAASLARMGFPASPSAATPAAAARNSTAPSSSDPARSPSP